ncbi:MAG: prepilin-type N-terminal cleavage/methylation domain-containing protein [Bacilli bacterium]|nr:prepilin-type N-terminal cleavage/methylation domain-containing protein [Bacilli bacterium]
MKEKGFTLVELLGVIVILAIIFVLIYPSVSDVLSQSRETVYQKQINTMLNATYDFSLKNIEYLPEYNEKNYVTLGELKYNGLLDASIKDPDTNEAFPDNLVISIHNVGSGYKYSNKNSKLEGDYLYTVEMGKLKDASITDLPTIALTGENLNINSNGKYITTLNLNRELSAIEVSAISKDGTNLTNKIKSYILLDDKVVEKIDSSKPGIYKINYSVVDNNGYANATTLHIIIADTIPPTINIPEGSTITKDIETFDVMLGVSCSDNSGFCDITTSTELLEDSNKYMITYTVKDPNGNTITKKRVITIE